MRDLTEPAANGVRRCVASPLRRLRSKDTWATLEIGNDDWAILAMNYWPERVREKCKTDKSLAIAHGLEDHYVEPSPNGKKTRKKRAAADLTRSQYAIHALDR